MRDSLPSLSWWTIAQATTYLRYKYRVPLSSAVAHSAATRYRARMRAVREGRAPQSDPFPSEREIACIRVGQSAARSIFLCDPNSVDRLAVNTLGQPVGARGGRYIGDGAAGATANELAEGQRLADLLHRRGTRPERPEQDWWTVDQATAYLRRLHHAPSLSRDVAHKACTRYWARVAPALGLTSGPDATTSGEVADLPAAQAREVRCVRIGRHARRSIFLCDPQSVVNLRVNIAPPTQDGPWEGHRGRQVRSQPDSAYSA